MFEDREVPPQFNEAVATSAKPVAAAVSHHGSTTAVTNIETPVYAAMVSSFVCPTSEPTLLMETFSWARTAPTESAEAKYCNGQDYFSSHRLFEANMCGFSIKLPRPLATLSASLSISG